MPGAASGSARAGWARALWGLALVLSVTWPFFLPGELWWRDMAVLHDMGWTATNFGGGDLPARAAPQDGLLAAFSLVAPADWLARALIIGAASAAAWAGRATYPAMALAVANPFVIERLLQGQWSLAVAAWLLPAVAQAAWAGRVRGAWAAMFLASLTPSGALLGLATGVACARGRRGWTAVYGLLLCLPWALPGLFAITATTATTAAGATDATASVAAFAPRAEAGVGTLGALATLGGIWNADAVPASRQAGWALCGLILLPLFALGARRVPRPMAYLAAAGWGAAVACWLFPGALAWLIDAVPGAGLARDSQKLVALALPFCVTSLAAAPSGGRRGLINCVALAGVLLQTPDYPAGLAPLAPRPAGVDSAVVAQVGDRTAFFPDRGQIVARGEITGVDPYSKAVDLVAPGALRVGGATVDLPNPRWVAAHAAWERGDIGELERLGIGAVVVDGQVAATTAAAPAPVPWALTLAWALTPVLFLGARRR